MAENRTEKPTKQKLKKAKEKGQVAKSSFLAATLVLAGGVLLIWGMSSLLAERFQESLRVGLKAGTIDGAIRRAASPLLLPVLVFLLGILAVTVASHLFQTGWIWSTEQIKPKWRKKTGGRRIVLPLLQFTVVAVAGYFAIRAKLDPNFLFSSVKTQSGYIFKKIIFLLIEISALFLALGLCDFLYQKWRYYKQMHMTPEEKREERRESEGDQQTKERMRDRRD